MIGLRMGILLLVFPAMAPASGSVVELAPLEVRETPYGIWGLGCCARVSLTGKLTGDWQPPLTPFVVYLVECGSPADKAGVNVGDEIQAVEGRGFTKLPVKEFNELFEKSASGESLNLLLSHPVTNERRNVILKLDSGRRWRSHDRTELNFWGVKVTYVEPVRLRITPMLNWPIQACTLAWAGKQLTLIENPGQGVDLLEGEFSLRKYRKEKIRKKSESSDANGNAFLGRSVQDGAILMLKEAGEYELFEAQNAVGEPK